MNREMRRLAEREERRAKQTQRATPATRRRGQPREGEREGLFTRLARFLREVRSELNRVSWPTREQMIAFTSVTLITTVALTAIIFGLDLGLKRLILLLFSSGEA